MEKTTLYFIIGLLVVINLYLYFNTETKNIERNGMEIHPHPHPQQQQPQMQTQQPPEIVLYYSLGCGHCQRLRGEWNEFVNRLQNRIRIREINCQTEDCGEIRGVPHIVLYSNGRKSEYNGNRTADDLTKWVAENI
jgi:thiol-disulfide isomerase/thioredoxin